MGVMASQITSLSIVYSTIYSDADKIKHQSSASLVNSPHKWPVTRKMFPFHDVIMAQWAHAVPNHRKLDRLFSTEYNNKENRIPGRFWQKTTADRWVPCLGAIMRRFGFWLFGECSQWENRGQVVRWRNLHVLQMKTSTINFRHFINLGASAHPVSPNYPSAIFLPSHGSFAGRDFGVAEPSHHPACIVKY